MAPTRIQRRAYGPKKTLTLATHEFRTHIKTTQLLLQAKCVQGISPDELQKLLRSIEERVIRKDRCWRLMRVLENTYWRMKYPVPHKVSGVKFCES